MLKFKLRAWQGCPLVKEELEYRKAPRICRENPLLAAGPVLKPGHRFAYNFSLTAGSQSKKFDYPAKGLQAFLSAVLSASDGFRPLNKAKTLKDDKAGHHWQGSIRVAGQIFPGRKGVKVACNRASGLLLPGLPLPALCGFFCFFSFPSKEKKPPFFRLYP